ncbi:cytoplasmic phosphatidylinositol transfer protein 1 isoform X2 [Planococcus citri]
MVYIKEYRICMPLTVEEYKVGQLYMIARHSHEQSENGEGVETISNVPCEDEKYGKGQFTEKRIHLSSRLPYWIQSFCPKIFYVTEKAWNYYPFTITGKFNFLIESFQFVEIILTFKYVFYRFVLLICISRFHSILDVSEYTCSFVPKLNVVIKTKFEDNRGDSENALELNEEQLKQREVDFIDIAYDEVNPKHYKEEEDLRYFQSKKTGRGPLPEEWQKTVTPIMCSYKVVEASFEVWGMQTKCEDLIHKSIREILVLGHRQAFAWVDEWITMSLSDVRIYECEMQRETNTKVTSSETEGKKQDESKKSSSRNSSSSSKTSSPASPKSPTLDKASKSWFSWE